MNFHNKPPVPHVPFVYRFTATALGASMWFFVREFRTEAWQGSWVYGICC